MTKEELEEYLKENGMTLTDEQKETFVTLDVYPAKVKLSKTEIEKAKNFEGLLLSKNTLKADFDEATKKLKAFEDAQAKLSEEEKKKNGEYEKLELELKNKLSEATANLESNKNAYTTKLKDTIINNLVQSELLKANVVTKYIDKALKLFDMEEVGFEITDEKTFEYKTKDLKDYLKKFTEENPFLFNDGSGEDEFDSTGKIRVETPRKSDLKGKEAKLSALEDKFPALRRVS